MPNPVIKVTRDDVVRRARSVLDRGVYRLGAGGRRPQDPHPFDKNNGADCSGFVAWCLGLDRYQPDTIGWIETTKVHTDAMYRQKLFDVEPKIGARPGDIFVWPDKSSKGGKLEGHIGIVGEVENGKVVTVIHCSSGNMRRQGKAVQETDARAFYNNDAIICRFRGLIETTDAKCVGVK
jgi:cell wall-associated NlpC family hydrolase